MSSHLSHQTGPWRRQTKKPSCVTGLIQTEGSRNTQRMAPSHSVPNLPFWSSGVEAGLSHQGWGTRKGDRLWLEVSASLGKTTSLGLLSFSYFLVRIFMLSLQSVDYSLHLSWRGAELEVYTGELSVTLLYCPEIWTSKKQQCLFRKCWSQGKFIPRSHIFLVLNRSMPFFFFQTMDPILFCVIVAPKPIPKQLNAYWSLHQLPNVFVKISTCI